MISQGNQTKTCYIVNFLNSRKSYFKDFSASLKTITELIKPYFVKLQSMVVIKIIHFVFFYQYSVSYFYSVYFISLYVTLSFTISFIYMSFFSFSSSTPFSCLFFYFLLNFNFLLLDNSQLSLLRIISFKFHVHSFIVILIVIIIISIIFILFAIFINYCFYFLVYSFCKQLRYDLQPAEMLLTISSTAPKLNPIAFPLLMNPIVCATTNSRQVKFPEPLMP